MREHSKMDVTVKGVCVKGENPEQVDSQLKQAEAVVVMTFRQHNEHVTIQQGVVMGDFRPGYYTMILFELVKSFGLGETLRGLLRVILNRRPYHVTSTSE